VKTSDAFPSNYLKAADIGDQHWRVTIDDIRQEELQSQDGRKQTKPVLYFRRIKKGLVLNITNSRTIEHVYGDEMDDWIGKEITLYTRIVEARGEEVNAIRVRIPQPGQSTAPSHHQPRPAPEPGYQSGMPAREGEFQAAPAPRRPAAEYTERNPPPHPGTEPAPGRYRTDMDDDIPF
jgi:hypothetical protein